MDGRVRASTEQNGQQVRHRHAAVLLRVVGIADALAFVVVVLPWTVIEQAHAAIGLGHMPRQPVVEYLVRSVSLLHAVFGVVLVQLAQNVRYYAPLLRRLAVLMCLLGVALLPLDLNARLPLWWVALQCGGITIFGTCLFRLTGPDDRPTRENRS